MNSSGLFYQQKPLFGFDIGQESIKVVQLDCSGKKTALVAYGTAYFDRKAVKEGEIVNFDIVSKAAHNLINEHMVGQINTRRIAASLPVLHSFSRIINLPPMEDKDVLEAIRTEASQYIPIQINDLYLDYQVVEKTPEDQDFLVAAAPKRVVDSYLKLFELLGLEAVCLEPSILSVSRIVQHSEKFDVPTLVIDCGSTTTDLIIYNKLSVRITGTIKFGGETLTQDIMEKYDTTYEEAAKIKRTHGLDAGKEQSKIVSALNKSLQFLTAEIKKIIRYYEERDKGQNVKVSQIIILGGGANLPGFSTYLTSELRIPTRLADIWENIDVSRIQKPSNVDTSMYATAAGLALIKPEDAVK